MTTCVSEQKNLYIGYGAGDGLCVFMCARQSDKRHTVCVPEIAGVLTNM